MPAVLGVVGVIALALFLFGGKASAATTGTGGSARGRGWTPPAPSLPVDYATAKMLAPMVADDVRNNLGLYNVANLIAFKEAMGLRGRDGKANGTYGGATAGALAWAGVQSPPSPLPGKQPQHVIPYKPPAGAQGLGR